MPITYKKGDLLTSEETIIMHGCNAQGKMGSGIAKAIKEKYPVAYSDYRSQMPLSVGEVYPVTVEHNYYTKSTDKRIVVNAITQKNYGFDGVRYFSYDGFVKVVEKMNELFPFQKVGIPKIGAGLGGGSWDVIEKILLTYGYAIDWVVYEL